MMNIHLKGVNMKKAALILALNSTMILAQDAAQKADPRMTQNIILFVIMGIVFFFMIMRPEQKKRKAAQQMRSSIEKGDKVITIGGLCGTITKVFDDRYVLQLDKNNAVTVLKAAIDRKDMSEEEIAAEKGSSK